MDQATTLRKMMDQRIEGLRPNCDARPQIPGQEPGQSPNQNPNRITVSGSDSNVGKTMLIDNLVALLHEQDEKAICVNRVNTNSVKTLTTGSEAGPSKWNFLEVPSNWWEDPEFSLSSSDIHIWVTREPELKPEILDWVGYCQKRWGFKRLGIIANEVANGAAALKFFKTLEKECAKNLAVDLGYLGFCPFDKKINEAMRNGHVLVEWKVNSFASRCLRMILSRLRNWKQEIEVQSRWVLVNGGGKPWL